MTQLVCLLIGFGLMVPAISAFIIDDSDVIAKIIGAVIGMNFVVGLVLFLTGVFW